MTVFNVSAITNPACLTSGFETDLRGEAVQELKAPQHPLPHVAPVDWRAVRQDKAVAEAGLGRAQPEPASRAKKPHN